MRRRCFSLIEVILAICLLTLTASFLSVSVIRNRKHAALSLTVQRFDRLLTQARQFAALTGHECSLFINKDPQNKWVAYIAPGSTHGARIQNFRKYSSSTCLLTGIERIEFESTPLSECILRFHGKRGLFLIDVKDNYGSTLSAPNLSTVDHLPDMTLSLTSATKTFSIPLNPLINLLTSHHFPQDVLPT